MFIYFNKYPLIWVVYLEKQMLQSVGKNILTDILGLESPSVQKPHVTETGYGCKLYAGNAVIHLYDFTLGKEARDAWHEDSSALEELGKPSEYGHFITNNVTFQGHLPIGWFYSVQN